MPIPKTERARKQAAFEVVLEDLATEIAAQRLIAKMSGQQLLMGAA